MYRITLECYGVPKTVGQEAARDITNVFRLQYRHERNVICKFVNGKLRLIGENGDDPTGINLMHEFADTILAYHEPAAEDIKLVSVEILGDSSRTPSSSLWALPYLVKLERWIARFFRMLRN